MQDLHRRRRTFATTRDKKFMLDPATPSILDKLPAEILRGICSYLPARSALSVARVCRALTTHATDTIWRNVDLSAERHRPRKVKYSDATSEAYEKEDDQIRRDQEKVLKTRMQAVTDQMAEGGGSGRQVKSINVVYRRSTAKHIAALLESASSTIKRFTVQKGRGEWASDGREFADVIDVELLRRHHELLDSDTCLSFPSLTHVTLGPSSLTYVGILPLLCGMAPNLIALDYFSTDCGHQPLPSPDFPRVLARNTKISHLRIDHSYLQYNRSRYNPLDTIIDLLAHSPLIRCLSLFMEPRQPSSGRLAQAVAKLEKLEDLFWREDSFLTRQIRQAEMPSSAFVRRTAIQYDWGKWPFPSSEAANTSSFPNLEFAIVQSSSAFNSTSLTSFPPRAPYLPLKAGFVRWLQQRPRLHALHIDPHVRDYNNLEVFTEFDRIEQTKRPNCLVYSIKHDGAELLTVGIKIIDALVSTRRGGRRFDEERRVVFPPRSRARQVKTKGKPDRQFFSHFEGAAVPKTLFDLMRITEDPSGTVDWCRRGTEVSASTWKILTDWRAGLDKSEVGEDPCWEVEPEEESDVEA